jgi:hypothetical protein
MHRQVAADTVGVTPISPGTTQTATITDVNGAKGTPVSLASYVGQKIYVQAEMIDPASGLASNPTNTVQVTVA